MFCKLIDQVFDIGSNGGDDEEQRDAIKRISKERRRFVYRGINVMLQREGICMNHKHSIIQMLNSVPKVLTLDNGCANSVSRTVKL
jgi:hypothetical protein